MEPFRPTELIKEILIITMLFTILGAMVFTFIESEPEKDTAKTIISSGAVEYTTGDTFEGRLIYLRCEYSTERTMENE